MIGRALLPLAAVLLLLATATGASASTLAEPQAVTLERSSSGEYVLTFAAQSRKTLREIAGKRVKVLCTGVRAVDDGFVPARPRVRAKVRVPKKGTRLKTGVRADGVDVCTVRGFGGPVAGAGVTDNGRVYVDELTRVAGMIFLPFFGLRKGEDAPTTPPPAEVVVERTDGDVVALDSPDATPPAGKYGYWTDGKTAVIVVVSAAGRRLWGRFGPGEDEVESNVAPYLKLITTSGA